MNGYNFTDRMRKVLAMARDEAYRLRHEYVGTEHLLLGLIREGEGVASAVLATLGPGVEVIRARVESIVKEGRATRTTGPDLPYTSRAKKVLELAMSEARELDHSYVGTEHLLLGLIREEKGIAAQVLAEFDLDLSKVRAETLRVLRSELPAEYVADEGGVGRGQRGETQVLSLRFRDAPENDLPAVSRALREAELRRTRAQGAKVALEAAWTQVRGVLELAERTGTPTRLERAGVGALWLVLGDDLMRVRIPGSQSVPPAGEGA